MNITNNNDLDLFNTYNVNTYNDQLPVIIKPKKSKKNTNTVLKVEIPPLLINDKAPPTKRTTTRSVFKSQKKPHKSDLTTLSTPAVLQLKDTPRKKTKSHKTTTKISSSKPPKKSLFSSSNPSKFKQPTEEILQTRKRLGLLPSNPGEDLSFPSISRPTIKNNLKTIERIQEIVNNPINTKQRKVLTQLLLSYQETYEIVDQLCKKQYAEESIGFLCDYSQWVHASAHNSSLEDELQTCDLLMKTYIYEESQSQINIDGNIRLSVIEAFNQQNISEIKRLLIEINEIIVNLLWENILCDYLMFSETREEFLKLLQDSVDEHS